MIEGEETGTASLEKRIGAAQQCQERGYPLGFHFDPIIFSSGMGEGVSGDDWFPFQENRFEGIVWISLGGFRYPPQLKAIAKERFPDTKIFLGELFPGKDGKFRYLKEIGGDVPEAGWMASRCEPKPFCLPLYGKQRGMGKSFRLGTIKQSPFESVFEERLKDF